MPLYRLKAGQKHYARNLDAKQARKGLRALKGGEELELTETQFKALRDKFELVGSTKIEKEAKEATQQDAEEAALEVIPAEGFIGRFNVRNKETDELLNDEPMTKLEADQLAQV